MAREVGAVLIGIGVGYATGNPQLGFLAAQLVYGASAPNTKVQGPRLTDLKAPQVAYGTPIPYIEGAVRTAGTFAWYSEKREIATETTVGGKGGPGVDSTTYTYEIDALVLLSINQLGALRRVWSNGKLIWSAADDADAATLASSAATTAWRAIRFYTGAVTQLPDPVYESAVGVGNAPAYRGRAYVFIEGLNLGGSGQVPALTFEVLSDAVPSSANNVFASVAHPRLGMGAPARIASGVRLILGQWDAYYLNRTVKFYDVDITGAVVLAGSRGLQSNQPSGFGNSDVPGILNRSELESGDYKYFWWTYYNERDWFDAKLVMPIGEAIAFGSEQVRFSKFGGSLVLGTSLPGTSGKLYRFSSSGGFVVATSANLASFGSSGNVGSIAINSTKAWAFTETGDMIHQLTLTSLAYESTITPPEGTNPGSAIVCDSSGTLYFCNNGNGHVYRRVGSTWVLLLDATTSTAGANYNTHYGVAGDAFYSLSGEAYGEGPTGRTYLRRAQPTWGLSPVALDGVVSRMCLRAGLQVTDIDVTALASDLVRSFAVTNVAPTRGALETLMVAYLFEAVEGDKLKFVKRGGAPVLTVPFADMGATDGGEVEPLPLSRMNDLEIPARVTVRYANVSNDYQDGAESGDRLITDSTAVSVVELPLGFTPIEAKRVAEVSTMDLAVSLIAVGPVSLTHQYARLEPTDVVLLVGEDGSTFRARIGRHTHARGVLTLELVLDDASVISSAAATDSSYTASTLVRASSPTAQLLLDIPLLRDADNDAGFYDQVKPVAGSWAGAVVYSSADDVTMTREAAITERAVFGVCTTVLPNWTGGRVFDETSTVTVDVGEGQLFSSTRDAMLADQGINAFAIGTHGRWELGQFRAATLVSVGVYTLSGFLRGSRGTEWASTGHVADESFALLTGTGMRRIAMEGTLVGLPRYYRAVSIGRSLESANGQAFANAAVGLKPFSPFDVRTARNGSGDVTLTWQRRSRLATRAIGPAGISVPLGEVSEAYAVEIFSSNTFTTVVRTLATGVTSATYTSAQQVADFGSNQATVYIRVFQLSAVVGRGTPAQAAA